MKRVKVAMMWACALVMTSGGASLASSDGECRQMVRELETACISVSSLVRARPVGRAVHFDDTVGYSALVLEAVRIWPREEGLQGERELCLYQRTGKVARVEPIE